MGAINYKTGKYITVGFNPNTTEDLDDFYFINDYYDEIASIKDNYEFKFFDVKLEYGYYEGFYIAVNDNDWSYVDDLEERKEILAEVKQLNEFLTKCIEYGLVVCHPGWCTGYCDAIESKAELRTAMHIARATIQSLPTYRTYFATRHLHS